MDVTFDQIRSYRLHVHHLDQKLPSDGIIRAAGACGLQNTPPGTWELSMFNRIEDCSMQLLQDALYQQKVLLQAWSFRGAPVVFPTAQRDVFLTALLAREGEQPWIYTRGVTAALDYTGMTFEDVFHRTRHAVKVLDHRSIERKEVLDRVLADIISEDLPPDQQVLWNAPSMYGNPDKQTVGGAAVSFMLRPCSFASLIVFGERQGSTPVFTSCRSWVGDLPEARAEAGKELVRKFLHCYGPATRDALMGWLGCSRQQSERLWNTVSDEITSVRIGSGTAYILAADKENLRTGGCEGDKLILLGAHDPYLDIKDRNVILEDSGRHREVWKFSGNPGAVLKGGRIIGVWRMKTMKQKIEIRINLWEAANRAEYQKLQSLAGEYAGFRQLDLTACVVE